MQKNRSIVSYFNQWISDYYEAVVTILEPGKDEPIQTTVEGWYKTMKTEKEWENMAYTTVDDFIDYGPFCEFSIKKAGKTLSIHVEHPDWAKYPLKKVEKTEKKEEEKPVEPVSAPPSSQTNDPVNFAGDSTWCGEGYGY